MACAGYDHRDAVKIAVNVIRYALLQDISYAENPLTKPRQGLAGVTRGACVAASSVVGSIHGCPRRRRRPFRLDSLRDARPVSA